MKIKHMRWLALCAALIVAAAFAFRPVLGQGQNWNWGSNWQAYYWNNQNFSGNPTVSRTDPAVNFNWQTGSPDPAIPADHFSARWYLTVNLAAGTYTFRAGADDGVRVAIDGNIVINMWQDATAGFQISTTDVVIGAGDHNLIVDYYEDTGNAGVQFSWWLATSGTAVPTTGTVTPAPTATVASPENLPVSKVRAVVIVDLANVRSGPATTFTPIAEVVRDEDFPVVANNGVNTWFLIQLRDGRRGWIYRRMIYLYNGDWTKLPVIQAAIQQPGPLVPVEGVPIVQVVVRDGPSLRNSTIIGTINQGQSIKILRLSRNRAWVFVDADGLQGWVYLPNIKIVYGNLGRLPVGN